MIVMHYCDIAPGHPWHGPYHDNEYGFPLSDETALFERLVLEIMQAGLSWVLILKKRQAMREAFAGFAVDRVAAFDDADIERLLGNAGIIRNRRKIEAVIHNAGVIQGMRADGGFAAWLDRHHPRPHPDWVKLFRKTFRFTGGEICREFLLSTGYLPGAHGDACPVQQQIIAQRPPWLRAGL
ncbi:MAG: DNA-3-methyladenine glycosylase I [Candidatus Dadabacteria bacterium]|nr:MAG: DNA-3-methyladenine glycosylase I [Candidatus Dadabacteria bacterium]